MISMTIKNNVETYDSFYCSVCGIKINNDDLVMIIENNGVNMACPRCKFS